MPTTNRDALKGYALRLNHGGGDLSKLSADERKHLRMLLREFELSRQLDSIEIKLSQGTLNLDEV